MNGEMPDAFNPKIWWLQLGLNDLGRMQCSEEIVVLGILRIVEEILFKKPNAKIVINSLMPMPELRGTVMPGKKDFQDSFQINGKNKIPRGRYAPPPNRMIRRMAALDNTEATTAELDTFNLHDENRVLKRNRDKEGNKKDNKRDNKKDDKADNKKDRGNANEKDKGNANKKDRGNANKKDRGNANKKDRRNPYKRARGNPKMNAHQTEQKKFNPVTHKERRLPLWTSISAINEELKTFCTKHERVTFFDATDIFAENDGKFWVLKTDMITLRGHPTPSGFSAWEAAVVERAEKLLKLYS